MDSLDFLKSIPRQGPGDGLSKGAAVISLSDGGTAKVHDLQVDVIEEACPVLGAAFEAHRKGSVHHFEGFSYLAVVSFLRWTYTLDIFPPTFPAHQASLCTLLEIYHLGLNYDCAPLVENAVAAIADHVGTSVHTNSPPVGLIPALQYIHLQLQCIEPVYSTIIQYCATCISKHRLIYNRSFLDLLHSVPRIHRDVCEACASTGRSQEAQSLVKLSQNSFEIEAGLQNTLVTSSSSSQADRLRRILAPTPEPTMSERFSSPNSPAELRSLPSKPQSLAAERHLHNELQSIAKPDSMEAVPSRPKSDFGEWLDFATSLADPRVDEDSANTRKSSGRKRASDGAGPFRNKTPRDFFTDRPAVIQAGESSRNTGARSETPSTATKDPSDFRYAWGPTVIPENSTYRPAFHPAQYMQSKNERLDSLVPIRRKVARSPFAFDELPAPTGHHTVPFSVSGPGDPAPKDRAAPECVYESKPVPRDCGETSDAILRGSKDRSGSTEAQNPARQSLLSGPAGINLHEGAGIAASLNDARLERMNAVRSLATRHSERQRAGLENLQSPKGCSMWCAGVSADGKPHICNFGDDKDFDSFMNAAKASIQSNNAKIVEASAALSAIQGREDLATENVGKEKWDIKGKGRALSSTENRHVTEREAGPTAHDVSVAKEVSVADLPIRSKGKEKAAIPSSPLKASDDEWESVSPPRRVIADDGFDTDSYSSPSHSSDDDDFVLV